MNPQYLFYFVGVCYGILTSCLLIIGPKVVKWKKNPSRKEIFVSRIMQVIVMVIIFSGLYMTHLFRFEYNFEMLNINDFYIYVALWMTPSAIFLIRANVIMYRESKALEKAEEIAKKGQGEQGGRK